MIERRRRRDAGPWRPGCEGLEGRVLLSLDFAPVLPGFEWPASDSTSPPSIPQAPGLPEWPQDSDFDPFPSGPENQFLFFDPPIDPPSFPPPGDFDPPSFPPPGDFDPPSFPPPGDFDPPSATLQVVGVEPADGATLGELPERFAVIFDHDLAPFSTGLDLLLLRADGTGGWVPVFDEWDAPFSQVDPDDPSRLVLGLDQPLGAGTYRLVLSGNSSLTDASGFLPLADRGIDAVLAEFAVARRGATLDDAIDLGRVGPDVRTVDGALDFTADPTAVALYQLTIPPSHRLWRLGLEVETFGLDASMTLFDARGNVLAAAENGGFVGSTDPHLFHGLAPGTYYVGISGQGNVAGRPGGYDPATGDAGEAVQGQPGGAFRLSLVADPVGASETRLGFRLNHADPSADVPTGFEIQFSGLVQPGDDGTGKPGSLSDAVELVDQDGNAWPIAAVAYDGEQASLRYVLLSRLPAGRYTIRLAETGGLVDLTGRAPSSRGLDEGVLAAFNVGASSSEGDPDDLGPVFEADLADGLTATLDLDPGESRDLRFVLLRDSDLRMTLEHAGEGLEIEILNLATGEAHVIEVGAAGEATNALALLPSGEYLLRVRAGGREAVHAELTMRFSSTLAESLSPSGVGQGPALSLRLVAPTSSNLSSEALVGFSAPPASSGGGAQYPAPLPIGVWPGTTPGPGDTPEPWAPDLTPGVSFGADGFGGSSTLLAAASGPVGLPADEVGFASPESVGGLVGAWAGLQANAPSSAFGDPSNPLAVPGGSTVVADARGGPSTAGAIVPPSEEQDDAEAIVAEIAPSILAAGLDSLAGMVQSVLARIPTLGRQPGHIDAAPAADADLVLVADGSPIPDGGVTVADPLAPEESNRAEAALQVSVGLVVLAAMTLRVREFLSRRLDRFRSPRRGKSTPTRHAPANHLGRNRVRERV